MARDNLYFIALLPPPDISAEVTAFKEDIAKNYNSRKALRVMPHITLKAPFKLPAERHGEVVARFAAFPVTVEQFTVHLNGFGAFPNRHSPVIFVHPEPNEAMAALQQQVVTGFAESFTGLAAMPYEHNFNPHMTIAYRDLAPEQFEKAWPVYKDKKYNAGFTVNSFCLLQHNGRQWNVIEERFL